MRSLRRNAVECGRVAPANRTHDTNAPPTMPGLGYVRRSRSLARDATRLGSRTAPSLRRPADLAVDRPRLRAPTAAATATRLRSATALSAAAARLRLHAAPARTAPGDHTPTAAGAGRHPRRNDQTHPVQPQGRAGPLGGRRPARGRPDRDR